MSDGRFEDLMSRLLDESITAEESAELIELAGQDHDRLDELRTQLAAAEMLAMSQDELRDEARFAAAVRSRYVDQFVIRLRKAISAEDAPQSFRPRQFWVWAIGIVAVVGLVASFLLTRGDSYSQVVEITELNGSLQWTGDGGVVVRDLHVGSLLRGGTLEALTADAWAQLEYRDGTQVTLSGRSSVTLSGLQQKELHLREGSLSAMVNRQPDGEQMLIHTPTAKIEVLGTQLNVDARTSVTRLTVNEGAVRVTRLVDDAVADVAAGQQIVASVDHRAKLEPFRPQKPVNHWDSLKFATTETPFGRWLPPEGKLPVRLRAGPLLIRDDNKKPVTLFVAVFAITASKSAPVVFEKGSRIRVRGRTQSAQDVVFGMSMGVPGGGFAGKFELVQPAAKMLFSDDFQVELKLKDFRPIHRARSPVGLELNFFYVFTVNADVNLELIQVQVLPPAKK